MGAMVLGCEELGRFESGLETAAVSGQSNLKLLDVHQQLTI